MYLESPLFNEGFTWGELDELQAAFEQYSASEEQEDDEISTLDARKALRDVGYGKICWYA